MLRLHVRVRPMAAKGLASAITRAEQHESRPSSNDYATSTCRSGVQVPRPAAYAVLATALVSSLAACSSAGSVDSTVSDQIKELAARAQEAGSSSQYAALEDGEVTEAELRQAYADGITCMTRAGLKVSEFSLVPDEYGVKVWFLVGPGPGQAETAADDASTECEEQFDTFVGMGWDLQYQDRYRPDYRTALVDCLNEQGVDASGAQTAADFRQIVPGDPMSGPLGTCKDEAAAKTLATLTPEPITP